MNSNKFVDRAIQSRVQQLESVGCAVSVTANTSQPEMQAQMPYQVDIRFKGELIGTFTGGTPDQAAAIATEEAYMILESQGVIQII